MNDYDQRLIKKLRARLLSNDCIAKAQIADEKILKVTSGTWMEMSVRIEILKEDLAEGLLPPLNAIRSVILWITRRMQR